MLPERNLDVLRAVAVLLVLADHMMGAAGFHGDGSWGWIWATGRLGVLLFFVHTSLVLMSSIERGGVMAGWVGRFYIRRAFRIYPLAIVAVLIATALRLPSHVTWDGSDMARTFPGTGTLLANLFLVQNIFSRPSVIGVLWSLPLEVQMYILLPVCFVVARRGAWHMVAAVLLSVGLGLTMESNALQVVPGLWRLDVLYFGPCFMAGVLAYHLLRRGGRPAWPTVALPVVLALVVVLFVATRPTVERPDLGWWPCLMLGLTLPHIRELGCTAVTRAAHQVAKYSYGIYLVHVPLLWVWLRAIPDLWAPLRWLGFLFSCVLLPVVLYRSVEAPLIRVGGAVARQAYGQPTVADVPDSMIAVP